MNPEESPNTPQTEGQSVPPEEQILPTGGLVQEDEQTQDEPPQPEEKAQQEEQAPHGDAQQDQAPPIQQAQSLARANPMPIALAASFVAGVVVGRIASRR
jgi:hypothetical protein